jgi:hypothetical protein
VDNTTLGGFVEECQTGSPTSVPKRPTKLSVIIFRMLHGQAELRDYLSHNERARTGAYKTHVSGVSVEGQSYLISNRLVASGPARKPCTFISCKEVQGVYRKAGLKRSGICHSIERTN